MFANVIRYTRRNNDVPEFVTVLSEDYQTEYSIKDNWFHSRYDVETNLGHCHNIDYTSMKIIYREHFIQNTKS